MPFRSSRIATMVLFLVPAFGVGERTTHSSSVASFFYACEGKNPVPRVRTNYTATGRPTPRPKSSPVEVYLHGRAPTRRYRLVGEVQVLASSGRTSIQELTDHASRGARRLGGDAIIDVSWCDAASAQPRAGDVGLLYLTAGVARWE